MKQELVKIKICSMGGTVYFVVIPYQIYEKDMVDVWIAQNLRNVDYWQYQ